MQSRNHRTASRHRSKSPFGCHSTAACNSFHSISSRADGICRRSVMVGSIVVSCSKWSCSVCSPDNSCRARASRSCRSKIVCNASASDWMVRRNSGESVSAEYHESISAGMAFSIACVSTKAVFRSRLPSRAVRNPSPCFSSFSTTFSMAELLFETTSTVFSCTTRLATMLRIVCVLPVPGGPWMMLI